MHLDGLRTYGAIKHDFETWVPNFSERGVILFHDKCVHDQDFGALAVMGGTLSASSAFQHDFKFHNIDYANLRLRNLLPHTD
ncbi:MAG: hypothetical protein ACLPIC_17785 [Rhodoblastus sp.]|uniref:hypothetical protein n=1 Tax=Rhodoblastus sp. TaxID=1962975 RepID=UPI003F954FF9